MSTDYSHFSQLAFDRLFAVGPDGQETLLINSSGVFIGNVSGALTVTSLTAATFAKITSAGSASAASLRLVDNNRGLYAPTTASIGVLVAGNNLMQIETSSGRTQLVFNKAATAFSTDIFNGVSNQSIRLSGGTSAASGGAIYCYGATNAKPNYIEFYNAGSIAGTINSAANLVMVGTIVGSNLSGTNTGNVSLSTSSLGITLAAGQILTGNAASSSAAGVVTTGTQSFAGTKTFVTALAGSNVASASTSAAGVVSTGSQSFAGNKTFAGTTTHTGNSTFVGLAGFGGGGVNTNALVNVSPSAAQNPLVGTTQQAYRATITGTAAATTAIVGYDSSPTTAASTATTAVRAFFRATAAGKGASSTITRDIGLLFGTVNQGTNNAYISDNTSFTGNWFINQANSASSQFIGQVTIQGTSGNTGFNVSTGNVVTIGNGTGNAVILNNLLATNGSQTATMTNLPAAATSGNPFGWLSMTINGTTSYIPFWH